MFSFPVRAVQRTQLFVAPDAAGRRQLTVYANYVDTPSTTCAMILPCPHPTSIRLHDMTDYATFFEDCNEAFREDLRHSRGIDALCASTETLEVHDVGSYAVSIAQCVEDLDRVDTARLPLDQACVAYIKRQYGLSPSTTDFGFLICRIKPGAHDYHPLAYTHDMARDGGDLFIPTRHYHATTARTAEDATQETKESSTYVVASDTGMATEVADDWDHVIYTLNASLTESRHDASKRVAGTTKFKDATLAKVIPGFVLPPCHSFRQYRITGLAKNEDLRAKVNNRVETPTLSRRPSLTNNGCVVM